MKAVSIIFLLLAFAFLTFGQVKDAPKFDIADFNKKFEVADWLVKYDNVAWKTSDVVMQEDKKELARLGAEWFCFQDKNNLWHAVYGKFENNAYTAVFHYTMDNVGKVARVNDKLDTEFLNLHARALATANKQLEVALKDFEAVPRFNQYIKQNPDKTFSVWLMPAFQTSGVAVYGGEFIYTIDASGNKVTKDESYFQNKFLGFKSQPPREIWLNYRETEKPTLGAIFFVWYYKSYFTKIYIDNARSTSTVIQAPDKTYSWVHVEKDAETKSK